MKQTRITVTQFLDLLFLLPTLTKYEFYVSVTTRVTLLLSSPLPPKEGCK